MPSSTACASEFGDQPIIDLSGDAGSVFTGRFWSDRRSRISNGCGQGEEESSLIVGLVAAGVRIAVVPATTRCIALPGVADRRIKGRDAHSTLYLARRKNDTSLHAKGSPESPQTATHLLGIW